MPSNFKGLDDYSIVNLDLNKEFSQVTDKETITLIDRESTKNGSPITKSFNLNFEEVNQAILKVQIHSDKGRILDFIPNEFKLNTITINGKVFHPSDIKNSINVIEKSGDSRLNHILDPNGSNNISVDFSSPIGAGFVSPNAEISAFLILNGKQKALPSLPNATQFTKDLKKFFSDSANASFKFLIVIALILIAGMIIILKVK